MESAIQFKNERGTTLRGIFCEPTSQDGAQSRHLVVFPNGGVMGAEGDFRANTVIARQLVLGGYSVLRFSPAGLGYSDGHVPACRLKNLFASFETGALVPDIRAAVTFGLTRRRFSTVTLAGICGGAISSFLAAADIPEVRYVIPIGIPVILDGDAMDYASRLPADEAQLVLKTYTAKLLSPKAWVRLARRRSNIARIRAAIVALFKPADSYISEKAEEGRFTANQAFLSAAEDTLAKGKKILFVFGDGDGFWWEFQRLFLQKHHPESGNLPFDIYVSHRANHMLTFREMQIDVATAMLKWLKTAHGAEP